METPIEASSTCIEHQAKNSAGKFYLHTLCAKSLLLCKYCTDHLETETFVYWKD